MITLGYGQIAHMTKSEMDYWDWGLLGPSFLFLNQYFNCFLPEHWVLWIAFIWGTVDLMRYCSQVSEQHIPTKQNRILIPIPCMQVCIEICDHLHIHLFRIPYPPVPSAASGAPSSSASSSSSSSAGGGPNGGAAFGASSIPASLGNAAAASKRQTRSAKRAQ